MECLTCTPAPVPPQLLVLRCRSARVIYPHGISQRFLIEGGQYMRGACLPAGVSPLAPSAPAVRPRAVPKASPSSPTDPSGMPSLNSGNGCTCRARKTMVVQAAHVLGPLRELAHGESNRGNQSIFRASLGLLCSSFLLARFSITQSYNISVIHV